jgi:CspA family cold shock protein
VATCWKNCLVASRQCHAVKANGFSHNDACETVPYRALPKPQLNTTYSIIDFGRTTGPSRLALPGARFQIISPNLDSEPRRMRRRRVHAEVQPVSERIIQMKTGTVKFYNSQKGFGFIAPEDGSKDVFVHATALEAAGMRGLVEGQKISFDVQADRRTGKEAAANLQHPSV